MTDPALNPVVGAVASKQAGAAPLTVFAAPTTADELNTLGERLVPKGCFKVEDLLFDFDSSFIRPDMGKHLPNLAKLRNDNKVQDPATGADIFPPLSIFGHADPVGNDDLNKVLSGRRATAFYAMLVRDTDLWEKLFSNPAVGDDWGVRSIQAMLTTLQDPIAITGKLNDETHNAIRAFQKSQGLGSDGVAGKGTRKALFLAYMDSLCGPNLKLDKTRDFLARNQDGAGGKGDFQGCGEFNPLRVFSQGETAAFASAADKTERNQENAPNRRVMTLLFAPGRKVNPNSWPCPRASEGVAACKKRFFPDAEERRNPQAARREFEDTQNTFACRFYQIISDDSPCERVKPLPPPPVLIGVNPLIFFPQPDEATVAAKPAASALVGTTAPAAAVGATAITPATRAVVVKKPQSKAARADVDLKTDKPFDGQGTFTVSPAGQIDFFLGSKKITFQNNDNVFTGDELRVGVTLFAEGVKASSKLDEVILTLTLSGGSQPAGPPATVRMTAVEVTLDICDPRTDPAKDPPALAQPPAGKPPAKPAPTDKIFLGRGLPEQDDAKTCERAILIVRQIKPPTFNGNLVLTALSDNVKAFGSETFVKNETALNKRHVFPASDVKAADKKFFAEGVTVSKTDRDTGFQLGIEGIQEDADRVAITVVHAEIVSTVRPKDVPTVALVPEKPERKTKSKEFFPAPIIIGTNYDVSLRPHIEMPQPQGVFPPLNFKWSTPAPAATLALADTAKEIVKVKGKKPSTLLNDMTIDLIVSSEIGKFKRSHKLTILTVEIDPVTSGGHPISGFLPPPATSGPPSDINFILNPCVTPILTGADAADTKKTPAIAITKIQPNLTFTANDDRIAWWIIGGETPSAGKARYEGRADFLGDENSKRGTKIQIVGSSIGDILVQPYSGGFGYGMFRTHVNKIHKIKYRLNRIITNPVPPSGGKPGKAGHDPTGSHADHQRHILVANIYLRQVGIELIPDDSTETASKTGNAIAGDTGTNPRVVLVSQIDPGHFDVVVDRTTMTFKAPDQGSLGAEGAIRVNARNDVITFAYIESLANQNPRPGRFTLAQAQFWPVNHAGSAIRDNGVPSTSLTRKSGIPPDIPAGTVAMALLPVRPVTLPPQRGGTPASDLKLRWGITVPTTSVDAVIARVTEPGVTPDMMYGITLAHEVGHVLGLRHRIAGGDPFPDGLTTPKTKNVMFPDITEAVVENFDIIQAKAMRLSEVLVRNP